MKQTVPASQPMRAQLILEILDSGLIGLRIVCRRQQL